MASRSFWKGYLKLSLVTCRVAMVPATSEREKLRFHTLNRATGRRVESRYVDAETGRPVPEEAQAKGYPRGVDERGADEHVLLEDEELEAVALESTRTVDIEAFVPKDEVGWLYYDRPHYLLPDDPVGEEAFAVIRDAMAADGVVGISRLVMYRREHAVLLAPRGRGIVLWTLRTGEEVRDPAAYFGAVEKTKVEAKPLALVRRLIAERTRPWDPEMVDDPVQARLLQIVAAKRKGRKRPPKAKAPSAGAEGGNVIDLVEALRRSLDAEGGGGKRR